MEVKPSPVKRRAGDAGIPVLQPATLRGKDIGAELAALQADAFVVTAYGLILPPEVLEIPRLGCVNVHFSLLPGLRGAAPVLWALIRGDTVTGVTIIQMDEGMDSGPILARVEEPVQADDTTGTLEARLAARGASLLIDVLGRLERGEVTPVPQDHSQATLAPKIRPGEARIDWSCPAEAIANRVRAFAPRPGAWSMLEGRRIKVWRAAPTPHVAAEPPGSIEVARESLLVHTGSGKLTLDEVQPEGRSRMSGSEFLRGYRPASKGRFD